MLEVGYPGGPENPKLPNGPHGLILRKLGDSQFSRLGVFTIYASGRRHSETEEEFEQRKEFQRHWFDNCEPQTITIV
jgi:hypothetical protein